ncbi:MAG: FAD:protein FMN transferase [Pseudomonadota bacterium]
MHDRDAVRRAQPLLGTFVEITVFGVAADDADEAIARAFAAIARVHRLMSFHDGDSDVSRLNRRAAAEAVAVAPWTFQVLEAAAELHRRSAGAFDIAVAPALQRMGLLPRHGADDAGKLPGAGAIELRADGRVRFHDPAVRIDLGGIAKGFAVDCAVAALQASGVAAAVVNAGGDLVAYGPFSHAVELRDPRSGGPWLRTRLRDQALASTGRTVDLVRSGMADNLAVIDPASGMPATAVAGAAVWAPSCMIADALTKIAVVAGDAALAVLDHYQARALLVSCDGEIRVSAPELLAAGRLEAVGSTGAIDAA